MIRFLHVVQLILLQDDETLTLSNDPRLEVCSKAIYIMEITSHDKVKKTEEK